ncbi:MAG: homocysteine biosynthesis protein [Clostridiales bacterium]|nr:homocysteine biosynthesis protein [Clostridiales bacterium]MCF8021645.1 homocysteine biosynthesis protein [Clostridiales bacterium]
MPGEKSYEEINQKIKEGKAVVVTAEELISMVDEKGVTQTTQEVDVVTTGTFSPMCSSGAFLNIGHTIPKMKMNNIWLNDVPVYGGIAAVDAYIGAASVPENDPFNNNYPGEFKYGGGHVIHDLVARKSIHLEAEAYGTDCYPRRELETTITLDDINEATLFNPRNCYQSYNCAVNLTSETVYTYLGMLKPNMGNAHYATAGQLSPLLKDPYFKTIGVGTRIFLGGGIGYVAWNGTQHSPGFLLTGCNNEKKGPAGGTLSVLGDLKQMKPEWLLGTSVLGYGSTLTVGIGIPIPVLNEEICYYASVKDKDLYAPVIDYGEGYQKGKTDPIKIASFAELKSGKITINDKEVPTAPLTSYTKAKEIAVSLKEWIACGKFTLGQPSQLLPGPDNR